jgi:hypothetical protein
MLGAVGRDALLVHENAARDALVNADRAGDLAKLARAFDAATLHALVRGAEATERQIAGNAAVEHALAAFFTRIAPATAAPATR